MILRTLSVEGWRCFADRVTVGPLGERINVLFGPNGTGKSTLMGALVRGLLDNHAVGGKAVEAALRPWGRELNPRVEIEFEHDGQRYRIAKQFLKSQQSELSREEGDRFTRFAEGESADRKVREMLGASLPGRGLTDHRFWGWAQVLWAPQDGLALHELDQGIAGTLRAALGAQASDAGLDAVERRIKTRYDAVFTGTGKLRSGKDAPPIVALEKQLEDARRRCLELTEKVAAFETAGRRIEDLRHRRDQLALEETEVSTALESARARVAQYDKLRAERDTQQEAAKAARTQFEQLTQRTEQIAQARQELADAQKEQTRLEKDAPLLEKEVEHADTEVDRVRSHLTKLRGRRVEIDAADRRAKQARRFVENRRQATETEKLLTQITEAQAELDALNARRAALVAPDKVELQAVRMLVARKSETERELAAAMITVHITPETDTDWEILAGEATEPGPLTPGKPRAVQGSPIVELRLPGVASIRATGPQGASIEELRIRLAVTNEELDAVAERFQTQDLAALERLHDQAQELDRQAAEVRVRIETHLGDRMLDDLRRAQAVAAQVVDEIAAQQPGWKETPPDADQLDAEAQERRQAFIAHVEQAERDQDRAIETQSRLREKLAGHRAGCKAASQEVQAITRRLEELT
ncbi:MAG: AAA family ATPase, partial [Pirellulales bacterium]|nr:AAA family ATPase [Pirellulales bacterium]